MQLIILVILNNMIYERLGILKRNCPKNHRQGFKNALLSFERISYHMHAQVLLIAREYLVGFIIVFQRYDFIDEESLFETCGGYHVSENLQIFNLTHCHFHVLPDVQVELLKHFKIYPLVHGMLI